MPQGEQDHGPLLPSDYRQAIERAGRGTRSAESDDLFRYTEDAGASETNSVAPSSQLFSRGWDTKRTTLRTEGVK